jgi:hypothetical protein
VCIYILHYCWFGPVVGPVRWGPSGERAGPTRFFPVCAGFGHVPRHLEQLQKFPKKFFPKTSYWRLLQKNLPQKNVNLQQNAKNLPWKFKKESHGPRKVVLGHGKLYCCLHFVLCTSVENCSCSWGAILCYFVIDLLITFVTYIRNSKVYWQISVAYNLKTVVMLW